MHACRSTLEDPTNENEPTAEQLVAYLSKLTVRVRGVPAETAETNAQAPYKARPISFEATRWEALLLWAHAHRVRLSIGGTLFVFTLITAYLLKLVSLNAEIDRQWRVLETALRDRYALAPAYVECIQAYSDGERYTVALAQKGLNAWQNARTDAELVAAAAQMERVLKLLSKVMTRYDQEVPVKEPEQIDSSAAFARLERQKEHSRQIAGELVQRYDAAAISYNRKVDHAPGSWIAWVAQLHRHPPIFASDGN